MAEVQWVGRSWSWYHTSVTSGIAYPQVAVVKSLPSQDTLSHGAHSTSSCPSSPPAHFPSPPEEDFTICQERHATCKQYLGPKLIRIAYDAMTELWCAGCAVSLPRTKSARTISWGGCSFTIWQRDSATRRFRWHGHVEYSDVWLKKVQKLNPTGSPGRDHPTKPGQRWSAWTV